MQSRGQGNKRVLIMAGGTGGHIFPGLAVAYAMRADQWQISWLGANNGLESQLVPAQDITLHTLPVAGLRGKGWFGLLAAPYRLVTSMYQAYQLLTKIKPDVVIGFGGYASGPGGIAAKLLRIPLIIHEQNAIAGLTNRILAKFAKVVLQAFPNSFADKVKAITVGNPIRQELLQLPEPSTRVAERNPPLRILIMGGSRGAIALNNTVVEGLARISEMQRPEIWHQTGEKHFADTLKQYQDNAIVARVEPFIDHIAEAYAWADLVICRAGALTVSELAAVGIGSILVPYPHAVDDHQTANAKFLEKNKAAILIPQSDFIPEQFVKLYQKLLTEPETVKNLALAAYSLRQVNAVEIIKQYCENCIKT